MEVTCQRWCADNSRRAFYKEFVKVVEAADVIIEVLDARDPLSTRCTDVERYVRRSGASKKLILLLNKIGEPSGLTPSFCPSNAPAMQSSCWYVSRGGLAGTQQARVHCLPFKCT